jgi:hypothetical protein
LSLYTWIETSWVGVWVRESPWGFPGSLVVHAWSMAFVGGISVLLALGIFGLAPRILHPLLDRYLPVTWAAFVVSLLSGLVLLATYPDMVLANPVFYVKMVFIAAALSLAAALKRRCAALPAPYEGSYPGTYKVHAALILVAWFGAIASGRLLYYTY